MLSLELWFPFRAATVLSLLTKYNPADVSVKLVRDRFNAFDSNAVAVTAAVKGKVSAVIGYLPKAVSMTEISLAWLLRKVTASVMGVTKKSNIDGAVKAIASLRTLDTAVRHKSQSN